MSRRKSIISLLLVLLMASSGHSDTYRFYYPNNSLHLNNLYFDVSRAISSGTRSATLKINNPGIRTDWIKVRYMGGECSYDAAAFPIVFTIAEYTDQLNFGQYYSFVSCNDLLLFKLRGPPGNVV